MISAGLTFSGRAEAHRAAGLVGPNAVIQLVAALGDRHELAQLVFARAGLMRMLENPPDAMIDQSIPARLFDALYAEAPAALAAQIAHCAGVMTGQYILANRIPRAAQYGLRALPRAIAVRLLMKAILRHAWTFAGTGICTIQPRQRQITLLENPMPMPDAAWHLGVFEALFTALVAKNARLSHEHLTGRDVFTLRFGG